MKNLTALTGLSLFVLCSGIINASEQTARWQITDREGITFNRDDFANLPNGGYPGYLLEYYNPGTVVTNPNTGGFALTERTVVNMHGESIKWQRYYLNNSDITNPVHPGMPLIDIPLWSLHTFKALSLMADYRTMGYHYNTEATALPVNSVKLASPGTLGGPTLIPAETSDRQPATSWGAPAKRRQFHPGFELYGHRIFNLAGFTVQGSAESILHRREYLASDDIETSDRQSALISATGNNENYTFAYQSTGREHLMAERSFNFDNTFKGRTHAALLSYLREEKNESLSIAGGFYRENFESYSTEAVIDIEDQIHFGDHGREGSTTSWFIDSQARYSLEHIYSNLWMNSSLRLEGSHYNRRIPGDVLARTYKETALDVTVYSGAENTGDFLSRVKPVIGATYKIGGFTLEPSAGLLFESGWAGGVNRLLRAAPAAALEFEHEGRESSIRYSGGLRHEPVPVTLDELYFLNRSAYSGKRYLWNDADGDLKYDSSEQQGFLANTGGAYHVENDAMNYPVKEQLDFATHISVTDRTEMGFVVQGKLFRNLLRVEYDPATAPEFTAVERTDIDGGTAYNVSGGLDGDERYRFGSVKNAYYASLEYQLIRHYSASDPVFINFTVGTYYFEATTVPGNTAWTNDIGIYNETTADPNTLTASRARPDYDRGYLGRLTFGLNWADRFIFSNVIRYRDGEPVGEVKIVEGLSQGPVIIQNEERAQPPLGIGRYTYALSWDVRFRYNHDTDKTGRFSASFDIYNLLDSRTEYYEYALGNEHYRDPEEMVMGRTYRVLFSWSF